MRSVIWLCLFVGVIVATVPGCPDVEKQRAAAAQKAADAANTEKMHNLGRQYQDTVQKMNQESAADPSRTTAVTARYMADLDAIETQVKTLPQAQQDEFARTYRKK